MADTKMLGDGLNLKPAPEPRRLDGNLPAKALRHIVSDEQLEALKAQRADVEQPLLWAALGVALGSATGSISALNAFLKSGTLTIEGFVQNICFFSALLAAAILMVTYLPRRNSFSRLIDQIRSRGEG